MAELPDCRQKSYLPKWDLIPLICLVFVLLAIYFFVSGDISSQNFLLNQSTQEFKSPDFSGLQTTIDKYNEILPMILSFYQKQESFSDILSTINSISKPDGLSVVNISLSDDKKNTGKIIVAISGVSPTRDNLLEYKNNISKEPAITNVLFSPESWINPKNINFSVAFDINNNGK